jgi:hypothetical protein
MLVEKKILFNPFAPTATLQQHHFGDEMTMDLHFVMHAAYSECSFEIMDTGGTCQMRNCFVLNISLSLSLSLSLSPPFSLKLHHERRPLSMKTDIIKKRQRYENGPTAPKARSSRKGNKHGDDGENSKASPLSNSDDTDESPPDSFEHSDHNMDYSYPYSKDDSSDNAEGAAGSLGMSGY